MNSANIFQRRQAIEPAMQQIQSDLDDCRIRLEQAPPLVGNGQFLGSLEPAQEQAFQDWIGQHWSLPSAPISVEEMVKLRKKADELMAKLTVLQAELDAEDGFDDVTLLAFLNEATNPLDLINAYTGDPVLPSQSTTRQLRFADAQALLQARQQLPNDRFTSTDQVNGALNNRDLLPHLYYSAMLAKRQLPASIRVGVLLPLRLETRFTERDGAIWLRLRITPDEPWMDRFPEKPLKAEYRAFATFLAETWQNFDSEDAQASWQTFCQEVEPARAAWLYRNWPRVIDGDRIVPAQPEAFAREEIESRIRDFPKKLRVHIEWDHMPDQHLDLDVKTEQLTFEMRRPDEPDAKQWWWDWQTLKEVGLGTELKLASVETERIAAIYVYGLSEDAPNDLFQAKAAAGELSHPPLGMPTNAVNGSETVPQTFSAQDWYTFTKTADATDIETAQFGMSLLGDWQQFGHLAKSQSNQRELGQSLVRALWYPLWGYHFKHIAKGGEHADTLGCWAANNLIPEGPLAPLMINDLPYGILPTTSLTKWQRHDRDPEIEREFVPIIRYLRDMWQVSAAGESGENRTVVRASSARLLSLLGHVASNANYDWWPCIGPLSSAMMFENEFPELTVERFAQAWRERSQETLEIGYDAARFYYPMDSATFPSRLPLVPNAEDDDQYRQFLNGLIEDAEQSNLGFRNQVAEHNWLELPNSLLERLLLMARLMTMAEVGAGMKPMSLLYPEAGFGTEYTPLEQALLIPKWGSNVVAKVEKCHQQLFVAYEKALEILRDVPLAQTERALKATIDTSVYRVDPWVTGLSWRRLRQVRHHAEYKLGAYGWVDRPLMERAGPTDAGYVLTPSQNQGDAAVVLRDKAIQSAAGKWDMDLDSRTVRMAKAFADEVKTGSHLNEAVGRAVEHVLEQRDAIRTIRERFPLRQEHQERRPCNGMAALTHLLGPTPSVDLREAQRNDLRDIEAALDSYGDLLVAQSVQQVISGTPDRAAQAMEAAAGLASPPELDVIQTQRGGNGVHTTVSFAIPYRPQPNVDPADVDIKQSPLLLADASVAAYLDKRFGDANDPSWTWFFEHETTGDKQSVTLGKLGLTPLDATAMGPDQIKDLFIDMVLTPAYHMLSAEEMCAITGGFAGPCSHALMRELIATMGIRPATASDFEIRDAALRDQLSTQQRNAYRQRYRNLYALAQQVLQHFQNGDQSPTQKLLIAARWGIVPRKLPDDEGAMARLEAATAALAARIQRVPNPNGGNEAQQAAFATMSITELATACSDLATSDGTYPIMATFEPLRIDPETQIDPDYGEFGNGLDQEWLSVVAPVRKPLARLEAWQSNQVLSVFENHPDGDPKPQPLALFARDPKDPWRKNALKTVREQDLADAVGFHAFYTPTPDSFAKGDLMAIAIVDRWNEYVPDLQHDASVSFGFNAPSSRAQQAILLAVPPDLNRQLDTDQLHDILKDTRANLRARMVREQDLNGFGMVVGTAFLPTHELGGAWTRPNDSE